MTTEQANGRDGKSGGGFARVGATLLNTASEGNLTGRPNLQDRKGGERGTKIESSTAPTYHPGSSGLIVVPEQLYAAGTRQLRW